MKKVPDFKSDAELDAFLAQDLSDLDYTQFKPMRFESATKEAFLNMRLPVALMDVIRAKAKGIPYARYVRMVLEADVQQGSVRHSG